MCHGKLWLLLIGLSFAVFAMFSYCLICVTAIDSADVMHDIGVSLDSRLTTKHHISKYQ